MKFTMLIGLLVASLAMGQNTSSRQAQRPEPSGPPAVNLVNNCESTARDVYSMCAGWMAGLMLGIDASENLKDVRSICFPSGYDSSTTQDNLRKIFAKYVAANPKKLDVHVGHVAYQAFLEVFPCKK